MSKYLMKNNEKSARSHPRLDYEKTRADSSQQQQRRFQKVLLGHRRLVVECYSKVHSKFKLSDQNIHY